MVREGGARTMQTLVTDLDIVKVANCLEVWRRWPGDDRDAIDQLQRKVNTAGVIPSDDIPADVVTLNSRVRVRDLAGAGDATYTLVLTPPAGNATSAISVVSPLGAALLGRREGDEIGYWLERGLRRIRIEALLFQPEAAARPSGRERIPEGGT
jgi:regulator of nucleoside diphosphate kinase